MTFAFHPVPTPDVVKTAQMTSSMKFAQMTSVYVPPNLRLSPLLLGIAVRPSSETTAEDIERMQANQPHKLTQKEIEQELIRTEYYVWGQILKLEAEQLLYAATGEVLGWAGGKVFGWLGERLPGAIKSGEEFLQEFATNEEGFARIPLPEGAPQYTAGQLRQFEKQLANEGIESLNKALSTLEKRLSEHLQKLNEIQKAGGYTSSVEREIRNFQSQIEAIKTIVKEAK